MDIKSKTHISPQANQIKDKYAKVPKEYMRIAEGMESQFNQMLLAQMKKTVDRANPNSAATRLYESMLDEHYADIMASSQGTGIKDLVLNQIYPEFSKAQAVKNYQINQKGNGHEHN